jgi:hypothetical protein
MGKNEKAPFIVFDDVEYAEEDLSQEQKAIVSHIADLERKIGSIQFNLDQMNVGKAAFINMLKESLTPKE